MAAPLVTWRSVSAASAALRRWVSGILVGSTAMAATHPDNTPITKAADGLRPARRGGVINGEHRSYSSLVCRELNRAALGHGGRLLYKQANFCAFNAVQHVLFVRH